ncbi:MAG: hypothetical protein PCFJNLEI_00616 [Verrucomicrobiae bacterium]|nr:hypothetical protein [Verrucomicrobiae bacterium]
MMTAQQRRFLGILLEELSVPQRAGVTTREAVAALLAVEERLTKVGVRSRVNLVKGNFYTDPLPKGCDLAWVSAIVHQNSRQQNRQLFRKIYRALDAGGRIAIRDILMEESRTAPISGALFAVNMLVGTEGGGTFTFAELRDDLKAAGFVGAKVVRQDAGMNAVVVATKR